MGRIPTPAQPSFAAQLRGQYPGPGCGPTPNGVVNMGHHQTGFSDCHSMPRIVGDAGWASLSLNRRLPSPILEADDPARGLPPADMMADGDGDGPSPAPPRASALQAMDHPNAMDMEPCHADADPASSAPMRRGHVRSRHTINSWTCQPGMKRSFTIGYRSDCEKCRLRVPGHFNHIVIS